MTPPPLFPIRFEDGPDEVPLVLSEKDSAFFSKEGEKEPILPESVTVPVIQRVLYWLFSVALNIAVLIILGLILFPGRMKPITVEATFSDQIGDQLEIMTLEEGNINPVEMENYALNLPETGPIEDFVVFDKRDTEFVNDALAPFFDQGRIEITDLLSGRTDPGTKEDLIAKYGGNQRTTESVRLGLLWLKKQQQKEGNWSLRGPYQDGVTTADNESAATGLALLAFQGDGNTRFSGDYRKEVQKGWKWLLRQQGEDGSFFRSGASSGRFYTQAICSIALCELVAMEKKSGKGAELRSAAQKAIDYLVSRQNPTQGGWRYDVEPVKSRTPGVTEVAIGSDLSVTGWVLMALESARVADLYVPPETFTRIGAFLDSVSADDGAEYFYRVEEKAIRPSMIATGLLCREYLGWDRKNPVLLRGAAKLLEEENLVHYPDPPKKGEPRSFEMTNVYGWYSGSMMLKHLGPYHPLWRKWNEALSEEMPAHQEKGKGEEAGSWDPTLDEYGFGGGRLYVTVLSILCLEVYYRHLSLYQNP